MNKIISHINDITWTPKSLIFTFFAIMLVRLACEGWISRFLPRDMLFFFFEALHTTLFFGILFIICITILRKIALMHITTSITIMMFGYLLVIFPPIIDWIISIMFYDGAHFMSYYLFDDANGLLLRYVTFFGDQPHNGITYGTRIMIACALVLITGATYISTHNIFRTILACAITYTVFFLMSALPSLITFAINDAHLQATSAIVASEIASPTSFLNNAITNAFNAINIKMTMLYVIIFLTLIVMIAHIFHRNISVSLWRNIRPIQSMYHIGLLIVGLCVAMIFNNAPLSIHFYSILAFMILCISIISAWYSTVVFNDIIDIEIDRISNKKRPLIEKVIDQETYRDIGYALFIISLALMTMINMHAAAILLGYHAISFLYNTPPLRLKRFPFIATFLAAIASFFIVAIGYVVISPQHDLTGFPPQSPFSSSLHIPSHYRSKISRT
jgi:hypothetical protein